MQATQDTNPTPEHRPSHPIMNKDTILLQTYLNTPCRHTEPSNDTDQNLETVDHYKYLGITFSNKRTFAMQYHVK